MRKYIYLLIVIVAAVALWEIFGVKKPAIAPTITENASSSVSGSMPTSVPIQSAYFSEITTSSLGTYLTDKKGLTLYTFANDRPGVSTCTGQCLVKWPPYGPGLSATGTAPINLPMLPVNIETMRGNNGMVQFAWKGMPLYYFYQDKAPGDTLGEGLLDAWYVVNL